MRVARCRGYFAGRARAVLHEVLDNARFAEGVEALGHRHRFSEVAHACMAAWGASGWVVNLRATTSQKCEAVLRRAGIQGPQTCVSLNSRLESNDGEEDLGSPAGMGTHSSVAEFQV